MVDVKASRDEREEMQESGKGCMYFRYQGDYARFPCPRPLNLFYFSVALLSFLTSMLLSSSIHLTQTSKKGPQLSESFLLAYLTLTRRPSGPAFHSAHRFEPLRSSRYQERLSRCSPHFVRQRTCKLPLIMPQPPRLLLDDQSDVRLRVLATRAVSTASDAMTVSLVGIAKPEEVRVAIVD